MFICCLNVLVFGFVVVWILLFGWGIRIVFLGYELEDWNWDVKEYIFDFLNLELLGWINGSRYF